MSHQGLFGLRNPYATCESSFGGYIWMGSESVFLDCLWVNRGYVGWRIHSSPLKAILGAVSERERLGFSWLFMTQKWLCGQTNPFVTCARSFGGYFWMGTESVFFHCLWVNRGCRGWRIHSSLVKIVSRVLLSEQQLSFPRLFMSHQGLFGLPNSFATSESSFGSYNWMSSKSIFLECLWLNRSCVGWRIHSSPVKTVSGAVSKRATTQFFVAVYESKGAEWPDEFIRRLCR